MLDDNEFDERLESAVGIILVAFEDAEQGGDCSNLRSEINRGITEIWTVERKLRERHCKQVNS